LQSISYINQSFLLEWRVALLYRILW